MRSAPICKETRGDIATPRSEKRHHWRPNLQPSILNPFISVNPILTHHASGMNQQGDPPRSNTMSPSMETTQIIASKKAQYTRLVDTNQWSLLDTILLPEFSFKMLDHEGAIMSLGGAEIKFASREEWKTHFGKLFETKQKTHLVGFPELEQIGPDEIVAWCTLQASVADIGARPKGRTTLGGHYRDTWKRVDGEWWLAEVVLELSYFTGEE